MRLQDVAPLIQPHRCGDDRKSNADARKSEEMNANAACRCAASGFSPILQRFDERLRSYELSLAYLWRSARRSPSFNSYNGWLLAGPLSNTDLPEADAHPKPKTGQQSMCCPAARYSPNQN